MSKLQYSIKDLENFTQIKAHTIRIWEQRYGLLTPARTSTNIRYYNESDLKKILNINLLYNSGFKISKIAELNEDEIKEKAKSIILNSKIGYQSDIDRLILLILDFKGQKIEEFITQKCKNASLVDVYKTIFLPLFEKIGALWQVDSIRVIHEHYFSNIFKQILISEIQHLNTKIDPTKKALLFLHDTEEHEFSILLYKYILKSNGFECHYLGQKSPITEINDAINQIKPQLVITTFTTKINDKYATKIADLLNDISTNHTVIISGNQLLSFDTLLNKEVVKLDSIDQLIDWLKINF